MNDGAHVLLFFLLFVQSGTAALRGYPWDAAAHIEPMSPCQLTSPRPLRHTQRVVSEVILDPAQLVVDANHHTGKKKKIKETQLFPECLKQQFSTFFML